MGEEQDPGQVAVDTDEAADDAARTDELEDRVEDLEDRLARALADKQNLVKRRDREVERARRRAARGVLEEIVPVIEDLRRALDGGVDEDGVRLVRDNLQAVLDRHDVERIATDGVAFDPKLHEAVARVETDEVPEGHVLEEVQPGYLHGDDVLRPSKVTVATAPDDDEEE